MEPSKPQTSFLDKNDNEETSSKPVKPAQAKRRPWRWLLLALLVIGGGIALWRLLTPASEAPAANESQQAARVKLFPVETAALEDSSEFIANLDSRRSVTLQPRIEGQISQIFVRSGDQIAAGKPIIQVDPEEQQAAVSGVTAAAAAAQADVANARATLKSLEAERISNLSDVQYNQREYQRYSRLADQGAVARSVGDQYTNRIQTAQAQLATTEAEIQAQRAAVAQSEKALQEAQANIRGQEAQFQYYRITAPFDGTVGDIPVKEGDFVNTDTQLTTITQNRPLEVEISVPIERGPQLRQQMPIELLDAQGKSVGTSRVFFISPNTNNATQSILIKSLFENSNNQLRADQYVRARVIWNRRSGVLIPATAITRLGGQTFVYVAQEQQAQPEQSEQGEAQQQPQTIARQKPVKLGAIQGNNYQVLEGLKPGERLIVSGILNLRDGASITPES